MEEFNHKKGSRTPKTEKDRLKTWILIAYFFILLGLWFAWTFFLRDAFMDKDPLIHELYLSFAKVFIWTVPALLLIHRFSNELYFSFKELFRKPEKWGSIGLFVLFFLLFHALNIISNKKNIDLSGAATPRLIGTVLFVGLTEEVVFRGWLLNGFLQKMTRWKALALNAVLFVLIHLPLWIYSGDFVTIFMSGGFLTIAALSLAFSWIFIESKSLFPPIFLHMLWNLLTMLSI